MHGTDNITSLSTGDVDAQEIGPAEIDAQAGDVSTRRHSSSDIAALEMEDSGVISRVAVGRSENQ